MIESNPGLWRASQRRGLVVILCVLLIIFGGLFLFNTQMISDREPARGPMADQLADRLDPNTASAAELSAIPTIGEKRAEAIVEFREKYIVEHPGEVAFGELKDLQRVKGIGAATTDTLGTYLRFPPVGHP
jgi:competence ComEA-like helix-hairpin-helix protein